MNTSGGESSARNAGSRSSRTQTFLASAEAVFRARGDDPGFDFSGPMVEYAKAVETELNAVVFGTLREALAGAPPPERQVRLEDRPVDVVEDRVPHQSLGSLLHLLQHDGTARKGVKKALGKDADWVLGQLPYQLEPLVKMRSPAAHEAELEDREVRHQRGRILGIGSEGLLVRVVKGKE